MKPVIFAFLALVAVIFGVGWMDGRFGNKPLSVNKVGGEKVLYFDNANLEVGKEMEIGLLGEYGTAPITSYWVEFGYDPSFVKMSQVMVDSTVFGSKVETEIDDSFGRVKIVVTNDKNIKSSKTGIQKLATIKMVGLKKGKTVLAGGRRPEVTVFENNRYMPSDFRLNTFVMVIR